MKLGSHVSMSGKEMLLGAAKEAVSYGSDTFMIYSGAPQNTRRKAIEDLNIEAGWEYARAHQIDEIFIHAPYIINMANTVKPEVTEIALEFLTLELQRCHALRSKYLILHPGAHVGEGTEAGTRQIIKGINDVFKAQPDGIIALETMAGSGSQIGRTFEEIAAIYQGVEQNHRLRVCFDTCHVHDAGYDIIDDFDGVMTEFDKIIGVGQIAVFHINDSKNPRGAKKDRHENIGFGEIGFKALNDIVRHPDFDHIPKILETPYVPDLENPKKSYPPYRHEIAMLRKGDFMPDLKDSIRNDLSK